MVDIGGRRLRAVSAGAAGKGPLVLLEAGAFGFSADWAAVQETLAERGVRSLAYDRAGLGFSDPGSPPRDSEAIVADLEGLVGQAGEAGPFVLCGHSMAGLHLRLFGARNAARCAGVVLVDATTPEAMDSRLLGGMVDQFGAVAKMAAVVARAGVFGHLAHTSWGDKIGLDGAAAEEKRWAFASASHNHWAAQEVAVWRRSAAQGRAAGPFDPRLPVSVILAGGRRSRPDTVTTVQTAPARASLAGSVTDVEGASHATILSARHAGAVADQIERVRRAADAC